MNEQSPPGPKKNQQNQEDDNEKNEGESVTKWQKISELSEEKASEAEDKAVADLSFTTRNELENQLNAVELKLEEYKSQTLRAQAELENLRRRTERDIREAHQFGTSRLITALLPVADSLVRALEGSKSAAPESSLKAMYDGMQLTLDLLHQTLAKFGVEVINPERGETFNPELHEAVSTQADPSAKSNTILQILQQGYQLNGRVIRAAIVVVAA